MRFLTHHLLLILLGAVGGGLLFWGLDLLFRDAKFRTRVESILDSRRFSVLLALVLGIFVLWAYVLSTSYYTPGWYPSDAAVVGDNYCFLAGTAKGARSASTPAHLSYPWLADKTILLEEKLGLLSEKDPMFLESLFAAATLPSRIAMTLALMFFIWGLGISGFKTFDALLATLFMASSTGCWLYGHQSNAQGIGIAAQLVTSTIFLIWHSRPKASILAVLGSAFTLCVYAHIGMIYFVIPGYLYVTWILLKNARLSAGKKFFHLCAFNLPILCLAPVYYWLAGNYWITYSPGALFRNLGGLCDSGGFSLSLGRLPKAIHENLMASVINVIGYWDPQAPLDRCLMVIWPSLLAVLFALGASFFLRSAGGTLRNIFRGELSFFSFTSLFIFLCYIPWRNGTRYYVIATVPNVIFMTLLLSKHASSLAEILKRRVLLAALVCTMVVYSGFCHSYIFDGSHLDDHVCYRVNRTIFERLAPGQKALYFRPWGHQYNEMMILGYYKAKFSQIDWVGDPSNWDNSSQFVEKLNGIIKQKGTEVYLSDQVLMVVKPFVSSNEIKRIGPDINQITSN